MNIKSMMHRIPDLRGHLCSLAFPHNSSVTHTQCFHPHLVAKQREKLFTAPKTADYPPTTAQDLVPHNEKKILAQRLSV